MSSLTPETPVHWADAAGGQQGPTPAAEVIDRIRRGELPPSTALWWPSAPGWTPADQVPELAAQLGGGAPAAVAPPAAAGPVGGGHATDALMDGLSDQQLDDEFIALIDRSWAMYKETEKATTIDEVLLGGIITAMVDSGFVMIDITSGSLFGAAAAPAPVPTSTTAVPPVPTLPAGTHDLRFEVPTTGARVTVTLQHLTPDLASASVIGHRARLEVGYGERLGNAGQIGQALRSEVASAFVAAPEPGTVSFDADISSGYVYANIDVLVEPDRYVDDSLTIDHDLLRRHIAALVHTMRTFVHTRFAS
jgi:hypothetical protein